MYVNELQKILIGNISKLLTIHLLYQFKNPIEGSVCKILKKKIYYFSKPCYFKLCNSSVDATVKCDAVMNTSTTYHPDM